MATRPTLIRIPVNEATGGGVGALRGWLEVRRGDDALSRARAVCARATCSDIETLVLGATAELALRAAVTLADVAAAGTNPAWAGANASAAQVGAEFWRACDGTAREQAARAADHVRAFLRGRVPEPSAACLRPRALHRTLGACPATAAQRAALDGRADAEAWLEHGKLLFARGHEHTELAAAAFVNSLRLLLFQRRWRQQRGESEARAGGGAGGAADAALALEAASFVATAAHVHGLRESADFYYATALLVAEKEARDDAAAWGIRVKHALFVPPAVHARASLGSAVARPHDAMAAALRALAARTIAGQVEAEAVAGGRSGSVAPMPAPRLRDPLYEVGVTTFYLAHYGHPRAELGVARALSAALDVLAPSLRFVAEHCRPGSALLPEPEVEGAASPAAGEPAAEPPALRVGFVSKYLGDHSIGRMMGAVLTRLAARHGRGRGRRQGGSQPRDRAIELHVVHLASGTTPASTTATERSARGMGGATSDANIHVRRVIDASAHAVHMLPAELDAARRQLGALALDILVYTDVGLDPVSYFLAAARLAPVQAAWWGHPASTGLPTVDWFVSAERAEPFDADAHYSERLWRMRTINTAEFDQQDWVRSAGRAQRFERAQGAPVAAVDLRIPASAPVFFVYGRLFKLHPFFDGTLARLMRAVPHAHVVLVAERNVVWSNALHARLRARLELDASANASVNVYAEANTTAGQSAASRVRFCHYWNFEHALRRAVAVLDTHPYGGCLTVLEALSVGVPVVTMAGSSLRGRLGAGLLWQMAASAARAGHDTAAMLLRGLVASDARAYAATAARLASNPGALSATREAVRLGYALHLHDNARAADEWAAFLRHAARDAARGHASGGDVQPGRNGGGGGGGGGGDGDGDGAQCDESAALGLRVEVLSPLHGAEVTLHAPTLPRREAVLRVVVRVWEPPTPVSGGASGGDGGDGVPWQRLCARLGGPPLLRYTCVQRAAGRASGAAAAGGGIVVTLSLDVPMRAAATGAGDKVEPEQGAQPLALVLVDEYQRAVARARTIRVHIGTEPAPQPTLGAAQVEQQPEPKEGAGHVALVIETRAHPTLPEVLATAHAALEQSWSFQLFHGARNGAWLRALPQLRAMRSAGRRVTLARLGTADLPIDSAERYSQLLGSASFWRRVGAARVLLLQSDSVLCAPHALRAAPADAMFARFGYVAPRQP
eukprot:g920.t1